MRKGETQIQVNLVDEEDEKRSIPVKVIVTFEVQPLAHEENSKITDLVENAGMKYAERIERLVAKELVKDE